MKLKTYPFDPSDHLTDTSMQIELLHEALESGDASFVAAALGTVARARGMSEIARQSGIGRTALYKSLDASGDPKLSTLISVVKALGLKLEITPAATTP